METGPVTSAEEGSAAGAADSPLYRMLRQALISRRVLILIDGLDEGGQVRARIEKHVTEVLAPQGHVLLATSRPAGIDEVQFARTGVRQLKLAPLTDEQQLEALTGRLGVDAANELLAYVKERLPLETKTVEEVQEEQSREELKEYLL